MRGFSEIFSRTNVQQIRTFLLYGVGIKMRCYYCNTNIKR